MIPVFERVFFLLGLCFCFTILGKYASFCVLKIYIPIRQQTSGTDPSAWRRCSTLFWETRRKTFRFPFRRHSYAMSVSAPWTSIQMASTGIESIWTVSYYCRVFFLFPLDHSVLFSHWHFCHFSLFLFQTFSFFFVFSLSFHLSNILYF